MAPPTHDDRARLIHRVFTGINTDNPELVADSLADHEAQTAREHFLRGHLYGFVTGIVVGAVVGVMIAGLPQCADPVGPALARSTGLGPLTPHPEGQALAQAGLPPGMPQPSAAQLLLLELVPLELRWFRPPPAPPQQAQPQGPLTPPPGPLTPPSVKPSGWAALEPVLVRLDPRSAR